MLFISITIYSCSSTNSLTIRVTEPAPVYIPSTVKSVGIVNRSVPTEKNKAVDNIDKVLSIEGKNMDKDGANSSLLGLRDELQNMNRFTTVKIIENADVNSGAFNSFPAPITWDKVDKICKANKVDALFVLSYYDTDTNIGYSTIPIEIAGPLGVKIPAIETEANVNTLVKTGWRIYDQTNKVIADEYIQNENIQTVGRGINPLKAIEAIAGRKEAVLQVSNNIGHNYALRIVPYNIRVNRIYYVRGSNNFKIGKRRARAGNWDGAAELWKKEVSNPKDKIAGRACYNMAIINEINGDLDKAVEWATKSYTDYNNKKGLYYINILKNRIRKNIQLEQESR